MASRIRRRGARLAAVAAVAVATAVLPAAPVAVAAPKLKWVALGDSYSAGVGGSGTGVGDCAREERVSYAGQAKGLLDKAGYSFDFSMAACIGAVTGDVVNTQLAAAKDADIVTLTIGGNDAGFAGYLKQCLGVGLCGDTLLDWDALTTRLRDTYLLVRAVMKPGAHLFVLTYPVLFSDPAGWPSTGCKDGVHHGTARRINEQSVRLGDTIYWAVEAANSVMRSNGKQGNVHFVDVRPPVVEEQGKRVAWDPLAICTERPDVFQTMNGLLSGRGNEFDDNFHPTDIGYLSMAAELRAAMLDSGALKAGPAPVTGDHLEVDRSLNRGGQLVSNNGRFKLALQSSDGHLVLYDGSTPIWSNGRLGSDRLVLQGGGNLVAYRANGSASWATNTVRSGAARLVVQDDGNVVLYRGDGRAVWATNTVRSAPPPTSTPGLQTTTMTVARLIGPAGFYTTATSSRSCPTAPGKQSTLSVKPVAGAGWSSGGVPTSGTLPFTARLTTGVGYAGTTTFHVECRLGAGGDPSGWPVTLRAVVSLRTTLPGATVTSLNTVRRGQTVTVSVTVPADEDVVGCEPQLMVQPGQPLGGSCSRVGPGRWKVTVTPPANTPATTTTHSALYVFLVSRQSGGGFSLATTFRLT